MLKHMARFVLVLVFFASSSFIPRITEAGAYQVELDRGRLTLIAESVPLEDILYEIERQTGVVMKLFFSSGAKVSAVLHSIPLETALKLLMRDFSHSMVYEKNAGSTSLTVATLFVYTRPTEEEIVVTWKKQQQVRRNAVSQRLPEYMYAPGALHLHNSIPLDDDPLLSMKGIDPLARFGADVPGYLPENQGFLQ